MSGKVVAVSRSASHLFSKDNQSAIQLLAGLGVKDDTHAGVTVQHRSRVARDPSQLNLRQVHLIHAELLTELNSMGFGIVAGQVGENITTQGIDLLGLPTNARLHIGDEAIVEIKGLRNPCTQLNQLQDGLMAAMLGRDAEGKLVRKAGVMGIVVAGGLVKPGDAITIEKPLLPYRPLEPV